MRAAARRSLDRHGHQPPQRVASARGSVRVGGSDGRSRWAQMAARRRSVGTVLGLRGCRPRHRHGGAIVRQPTALRHPPGVLPPRRPRRSGLCTGRSLGADQVAAPLGLAPRRDRPRIRGHRVRAAVCAAGHRAPGPADARNRGQPGHLGLVGGRVLDGAGDAVAVVSGFPDGMASHGCVDRRTVTLTVCLPLAFLQIPGAPENPLAPAPDQLASLEQLSMPWCCHWASPTRCSEPVTWCVAVCRQARRSVAASVG